MLPLLAFVSICVCVRVSCGRSWDMWVSSSGRLLTKPAPANAFLYAGQDTYRSHSFLFSRLFLLYSLGCVGRGERRELLLRTFAWKRKEEAARARLG